MIAGETENFFDIPVRFGIGFSRPVRHPGIGEKRKRCLE